MRGVNPALMSRLGELTETWLPLVTDSAPLLAPVTSLPAQARALVPGSDWMLLCPLTVRDRPSGDPLVGVLAGSWLSRRLTRRVQRAAETCDAIVGGDLTQRLPVRGSQDEFDALAQAVNSMVDRLAEKTQVLRASFDSAAHDLRAPLYRLRGRLEDAARSSAADTPVNGSSPVSIS